MYALFGSLMCPWCNLILVCYSPAGGGGEGEGSESVGDNENENRRKTKKVC